MTQTLAPVRILMVSWLAVPSMEALKRSTMSVSRRRRMASVSGSPKRVLNSRTIGPRGVIMMPQKRMPLKGVPSELMPSTVFCAMLRRSHWRMAGVTMPSVE